MTSEALVRQMTAAHADALRVGDSPLRADQLIAKLPALRAALAAAGLDDSTRRRVEEAIAAVQRTLRLDADGRDAARHLQGAIAILPAPPRRPSPFLDD